MLVGDQSKIHGNFIDAGEYIDRKLFEYHALGRVDLDGNPLKFENLRVWVSTEQARVTICLLCSKGGTVIASGVSKRVPNDEYKFGRAANISLRRALEQLPQFSVAA